MSMGNRASAPPSKGGPTPSTNPQVPNPYGSQFQPQRYSNDYFRYQQSGDAFNQPVMGYGTYGQIFTPPPRQAPPIMGGKGGGMRDMRYRGPQQPPTMGGKGGGMRDMRYRGPQQPPTMGGKGQPQPSGYNGYGYMTYPGGSGYERRRSDQRISPAVMPSYEPPVGVTGGVPQEDNVGDIPASFLDFYSRQNNLDQYPVGATPTYFPTEARSVGSAGLQPVTMDVGINQRNPSFTDSLGLGGMPTGGPQISPDYMPVMGERNFDIQPFVAPDNYISGFGNMSFFQEGGQVPPDANMEMMLSEAAPADPQAEMSSEYDRLIQMTMQAVLGQVEQPDEIIQMFIEEFGVDAFRQLRDAVLKQQVPNAQTEGMVDGNGGGMDDQVMGMIGAQRPVAVSPGEYIIPADVVSGLGDGSSKSGADILDELSQAVRMARTGTPEQPRPLMETLSQ